jgi:DNA-directed RNA polymerase specialized sigma subunit
MHAQALGRWVRDDLISKGALDLLPALNTRNEQRNASVSAYIARQAKEKLISKKKC